MTDIPLQWQFTEKGTQELRASMDAVLSRLNRLERATDATAAASKRSAKATTDLFKSFNEVRGSIDLAVGRFMIVTAAITKTLRAIDEFATGWDRMANVLKNSGGSVDQAVDKTNNLISRLDLLSQRARLVSAGLALTEEQFSALAVAGARYAQSTGGDAAQATEQLTGALISGGEELQKYGIFVDGVQGKAAKQEAAIAQLTEQYGELEAQTTSLFGAATTLDNVWDDVQLGFVDAVESSAGLKDSLDQLWTTVGDLATAMGIDLPSAMQIAERAGAEVAARISMLADAMTELVKGSEAFASGNFIEALNRFARSQQLFIGGVTPAGTAETAIRTDENMASLQAMRTARAVAADAIARGRAARRPRGGGGGRSRQNERGERELDIGQQLSDAGVGDRVQVGAGEEFDMAELEIGRGETDAEAQEQRNKALVDEERRRRNINDTMEAHYRIQERINAETEKWMEIGEAVGEVLISVFEEGPLRALDKFAEAFAKEMFLNALKEGAAAIASAAMYDYPAAGQHAAAAAAYGAAAIAAGGVAAAIDSSAATDAGAGSRFAPASGVNGGGGSGGGGGDVTFVINTPMHDPAATGRFVRNSQMYARRQYSARV